MKYEQLAYDGACGDEWLEGVGEGFKFYIASCVECGKRPTIGGFMRYIDVMADKIFPPLKSEVKRIRTKIANGQSTSCDHSLCPKQ